jgi:cytochrome c-type biogenesis protein CcmH
MTLLVILALMTAAALGAVIWPLARGRAPQAASSDLAVYRDQLEEIERDRADGRIGHDEFEAARVEVSRRLLAAANTFAAANTGEPAPAAPQPGSGRRIAALVAAAVAIPLLSAPLYALLGSPDLPGEPLSGRAPGEGQANSIGALIAKIETHLEENPGDGKGWEVVAPVYMKLERYDDAVKARRNALDLLGATADREVDLGEALTAAANGVVTAEAKAAFDRAAAIDGNHFKAMFYLGLAAQQDGDASGAARIWHDLIAKAPPDAPWLQVVRQSLARVEGQGTAAPVTSAPGPRPDDVAAASEMTPDARNQMIRGMVERLAVRLHEDGADVEGWLRLLRAYMVLGERDKAKAAVAEARGALARQPEKLRQLDAGIKDLGVEG